VPVHPPEAVHDVALVELQVSVEVPPEGGLAVSMAVGTGLAATVTVAATAGLVPPVPVQVSEYVVSAVSAPVLWLPLVANSPPQSPVAVHDVALVELQVSVEVPPLATAVGLAVSVAVGTDGGGSEVVTGTPDPPQDARSSAALATAGAKQRLRAFSNFRIMSWRRNAVSVIPQLNVLIHRSPQQGPLFDIMRALSSATYVSIHGTRSDPA
jgi:hypothetical protein